MKIFVTGGAGFIGSNYVRWVFANTDHEVTVFDSLTYAGNLSTLKDVDDSPRFRFVKGNICQPGDVESAMTGHDAVVHFAAESHVDRSIMSAREFVSTNVMGTQVLIDAAYKHKVAKFVHISTDEVYGSLGPTGYFTETTPLDPTSPYAASKAASDLMVLSFCKTHNFNASVTRCTNNYGFYHFPEKLIPLFITNAMEDKKVPLYGDGMNVRSWLFVEDHCDGLLRVAEKGRAGEVYNIGGTHDCELPNRDVTFMILEMLGKSKDLIQPVGDRPAHDRRYAVDTTKIKEELGWEARVPFRQGLESTVEWYQANRSWWEEIKSGQYRSYYEKNYSNRG